MITMESLSTTKPEALKARLFANPTPSELEEMENALIRSEFREALVKYVGEINMLQDRYEELPISAFGAKGPEAIVMEKLTELLYKVDPMMAEWPELQKEYSKAS